jgi:hypothetical protein
MIRPSPCWYRDPKRQPTVGWCPPTCNGPVTHSERAGNGDKLLYCEAHAYWRAKTIRLPLVRRLRPGEPLPTTTSEADADPRDLAPPEARVA